MTKGDGGLSNAEITGKCLKMARKYGFLSNSSGLINNFCQIIYFLPKKIKLFKKRVALNMFTKLTQKRKGGLGNADKLTRGEGGLGKC